MLAGAAGVPVDQPGARGAMRGHEATRFYTSEAHGKQLAERSSGAAAITPMLTPACRAKVRPKPMSTAV